MGDGVGVHTKEEVEDLTEAERLLLKQHILQLLMSSQDIRNIIERDANLLPNFMNSHGDIREVLRDNARPLFERLKIK